MKSLHTQQYVCGQKNRGQQNCNLCVAERAVVDTNSASNKSSGHYVVLCSTLQATRESQGKNTPGS